MTTIDEVRTMMPIVTDETLPEGDTGQTLYNLAAQKVYGLTGITETQGYCYYIAYLMTAKTGDGITSEHLGSYSVSYQSGTQNTYLKLYNSLLRENSLNGFVGTHLHEHGWLIK